jgi:hypothetical protein
MPSAADYEIDRSNWLIWMLAVAVLVMLFWAFSIGEPCLLGSLLGGGDPEANPIAITECRYFPETRHVAVTRGDALVREGALALLAALFAIVCSLVDPARSKIDIAGIATAGLTIALFVHAFLAFFARYPDPGVVGLYVPAGMLSAVVTMLAALAGTAIAAALLPGDSS